LAEKSASREKSIMKRCLEQTQLLATPLKSKLQNNEKVWEDQAEKLTKVQLAVAKLKRSIDLAAESIV
jgi:hypothetical protein